MLLCDEMREMAMVKSDQKAVCIGGPLHGEKVGNKGSWFNQGDGGLLEYSDSTIFNGEFKGKYIRTAVHLTQNSSDYVTYYVWESNSEHIKAHLHGG